MLLLTPLALEFIEENNKPRNWSTEASALKRIQSTKIIQKDAPTKLSALKKLQKVAKLVPVLNKFSKVAAKPKEEMRVPKVDVKSEIQYLLTKIEAKETVPSSYVFKQVETFKRNLSRSIQRDRLENMVLDLSKSRATAKSLLEQHALLSKLQANSPKAASLARDLQQLHHISSLQTLQCKKKQDFLLLQTNTRLEASLRKASAHEQEVLRIKESANKLSLDFNSMLRDCKICESPFWTARRQAPHHSTVSTHSIKPIRHVRVRGAAGRSVTVKSFVQETNNSYSVHSLANAPRDCRKDKSFTDSTQQSELANSSQPRTFPLSLPPVRRPSPGHKMLTE